VAPLRQTDAWLHSAIGSPLKCARLPQQGAILQAMTIVILNRKTLVRGAVILGLACILGTLSAAQGVLSEMRSQYRYTLGHALIMHTPFWVFWAALLPLIVYVARRFPIRREHWPRTLLTHVGLGIGIALGHYAFTLWFMGVIGHGNWTQTGHTYGGHLISEANYRIGIHLAAYFVVLGGVLAWEYYRKYRERELLASQLAAQLSQAKLQALRMQLNPHFLFNAMNSISMLVRRNENTQAVRMLAGLSDLLRYVLEDSPSDEVPLRDELSFLERYLEIERVRFQDRLKVKVDADQETLDAFVPNLLLQPLVENAIRHGIARKVNAGLVEIAARKLGDRLILQVRDDGPGLAVALAHGSGVGLANTKSRLEQLYGSETSFELRNAATGGAVVTISLPFHTQPVRAGVSAA
jgi:signal transduction histidine kinase